VAESRVTDNKKLTEMSSNLGTPNKIDRQTSNLYTLGGSVR